MKKRINFILIIAFLMLFIGLAFVLFSLNHPELSFSISLERIWGIYIFYILVDIFLFIIGILSNDLY